MRALERLLPRMGPHVCLEAAWSSESTRTSIVRALERLLPRMGPHVDLEGAWSSESTRTSTVLAGVTHAKCVDGGDVK